MMSAINETLEFMRASVRPIMIISGWFACILMWIGGGTPPDMLWYAVIGFSGEYAVERGIRHYRYDKKEND